MLLVAGLALVLAQASGETDRVTLASGKVLQGRVVFEDARKVVIRRNERDTSIARADVKQVESRVRRLWALLDDAASADLGDARALETLVAEAVETGLADEAQVFWWRLLLLDRENEKAHRALGHKKRGGGWAIPFGGGAYDWDKRFELARDWGSAWELASLHYRLRSNLPLETNLDVLLDLERLYRAFHELFGTELALYDVCQPMRVDLHADRASYPETAGEFGRYDPGTDVVMVDCSRDLPFVTVAHEVTHQLLYATAFRERDTTGEIPPWVNEGLAEYVAAAVVRVPNLEIDPGRPLEHHFRCHAQAEGPFDLTRVLAFSSGDFQASSDRPLKYAQSYTLVHFLLHGAEGRYRPGFLAFLREVYAGKGSATDLKRCLHVDWRPLEKEWHAHARDMQF